MPNMKLDLVAPWTPGGSVADRMASAHPGERLDICEGERSLRLFVVDGGMRTGLPSVFFAVRRDDGSWFMFETSARLVIAAGQAVDGLLQQIADVYRRRGDAG